MRERLAIVIAAALCACGNASNSAPIAPTGPTGSTGPTGPTAPSGPTGSTACDGLVPGAPGDGVLYVQQYATGIGSCAVPLTDGRGTWIGIGGPSFRTIEWTFVSAASPGAPVGHLSVFLPHYGKGVSLGDVQPYGYLFVKRPDYWPGSLQRYDATGNLLFDDGAHDVWGVFGLPGGGGVLDVAEGYTPNGGNGVAHMVWVGADGARGTDIAGASPFEVGSAGDVLALEGGKLRWYDRSGAPRTDPFTDAGVSATLQNGNGLQRRLDRLADGSLVFGLGSDRAIRLEPGRAERSPVPDWLAARSDAEIAVVRGGRANAFARQANAGSQCLVDLEVLTAAGESCGTVNLAAPGPCGTLSFGPDGTVFTTVGATQGQTETCTWRWWSGLLR